MGEGYSDLEKELGSTFRREVAGLAPVRSVKENITRNVMKRRKVEQGGTWTAKDDDIAET
jgi:hypothetical protein